jgi:glycosyltransferase involved in cell wall biosynthesis
MPVPIRVGFVVHVMNVAGAEMLVAEIIRRLDRRIESTVIGLDGIGVLGEQLQAEGIEVVSLDRRPGKPDWGLVRRLVPILNRRRIEVIHAHQYSPFFYAALAKPFMRRPASLIFTEHGRHFPDIASPKRRAVNRLLLNCFADDINACCQFSARSLCRIDGFPGNRIHVVPNGIDPEMYTLPAPKADLRRQLGLDLTRRYIINVARLHPIKDQAMLLRAFAKVAARRSNVDLLIAGDGPLRKELQGLAQSLNISGRVRFLGVRRDVPLLLGASDIFALTSISEAASLTLLEAMAAGLPIVATAVGGTPEIVRDRNEGRLVPRGNDVATAAAFEQLLDDAEESARFGVAGRNRVRQHYRLSDTVDRYYRIYERLCR